MFCVTYKFKVKEGMNSVFEQSWADFTEAIYRVRGSLGSRLHKTDEPQVYIAYAQWPSKEVFDDGGHDSKYTDVEIEAREKMRSSLEGSVERTYLTVLDDRLR